MKFSTGSKYSRPDVKELAGLGRESKGGNWDTGIVEHAGEFVVFANVGTQGRTGHDYGNAWENGTLRWYHKNGSHLGWASVQKLLLPDAPVHIFWRADNSDSFTYAGLARPVEVADTSPVEVLWTFDHTAKEGPLVLEPAELPKGTYRLGAVKRVLVNAYERDPVARQACLDHFGYRCAVCQVLFEEFYGEIGAGFVHVHHLVPLYLAGEGYEVDPLTDLRPVCPNCHAMLHRRRPPYKIEEVQARLLGHSHPIDNSDN